MVRQAVYGDLLLEAEVPVKDSYYNLPRKTLSFLSFAARHCGGGNSRGASSTPPPSKFKHQPPPCFTFALLCDDDVFVRLDELHRALAEIGRDPDAEEAVGFYRGQASGNSRQ